MNKFDKNSITISDTKQSRVDEAENFFNLIFDNVTGTYYGYLWTLPDKKTYFFDVSTPENRHNMAVKAIELSDAGFNVYYSVNLMDTPPAVNARATADQVTLQTATVTDIDVEGGTHISNDKKKYPTFDVAKSFLPFTPSILIDSGYGLHGLNLYSTPITITADTRHRAEERNKKYISVIRSRAGEYSKVVDSVYDLPRVLRVPGTRNYKLGVSADAPICHLVEVNDIRFTPAEMDDRLNVLTTDKQQTDITPARKTQRIPQRDFDDDRDFNIFRARCMLDFIYPSSLTYDEWLAVGMALKNIGCDCSDWENWSRADDRFKDGECESKWNGFNRTGCGIGTIYYFAVPNGYDAKETYRQWKKRYPESKQTFRADLYDDDDLFEKIRQQCTWSHDKSNKKTKIKSDVFNYELIFKHDPNLHKLFGRDNFRQEIVFLKRAPWHDKYLQLKDTWDDTDDAELRLYLAKLYAEIGTPQRTMDFVIRVARENSFHSIRNFLEGLPQWDGVGRAEFIFPKFLGAENSRYTREITMHFLFGSIARALYPGCDFQSVVVLQGPQGIGKSRLLRMLGGKHGVNTKGDSWHIALRDQLDDSHAVDAMRKGWIIEIEEFAAASRADVNSMKGVLSADDVTRRFAYDRHAKTIKAHWVFAATCNDDAPLRDQTGNRRFLPIKCNNKESTIVDGMTPDYIRLVWTEVYHKFKEMFPTSDDFDADKLRLSPDLQAQAAKFAECITQDDGLATEIKGFLDTKILPLVLWLLLTREERRDFIKNGRVVMLDAVTEFNHRRRARGGNADTVQSDVDAITSLFKPAQNKHWLRIEQKTIQSNSVDEYILYGSELRQHICAAEIFNECFGQDNRKRMPRINETLARLDGWHVGERLQKVDPAYPDQKKPYYRD